ncbi:zinc-binding dehydrogenase [Amycolatopsis sp. RM579]|uniref:Zinc-binding dehydrogenase n=1 Tax=Amycolatopsis pithecellobii TaxID=664692 RepID=A0A6N7Z0E3_9PSEU|nr:zinc-binding dehydrogenase [Amycolatopsis pithecellobii]
MGPGTRILVSGASSGLGSTTALLAKHLGATVVVTSRDEGKRARLRELGLDHVLDPQSSAYAEEVLAAFDGAQAEVIVDNLGVDNQWSTNLELLGPGGAVVSSGSLQGESVPVDLRQLYLKSQRIIGVRSGNLAALDRVWSEVRKGFRVAPDRLFALENIADAHAHIESEKNAGRVVVAIS